MTRKTDMAAAGEASHTFPSGHEIYDNDASFGKAAPDLSGLEGDYVKGEPVRYGQDDKPTVILFFSKLAKGEYKVTEQISNIAEELKDQVNFLGLNIDASKADAAKYVSRIGEYQEAMGATITANFPVAWDEGKRVANQFRDLADVATIGVSNVFVVDKDGKIVWREKFSQTYEPKHGLLKEQLRRLLAGEELVKVGDAPEDEDEDEDEGEEVVEGDDDDDDDGLF